MKKNALYIFLLILIPLIIFKPFFFEGKIPFPGSFMLAWYQPWKTDYTKGETITIQHKPVADDTFRYLYPFKKLEIDIIKTGELPLWNPYNGAGMPLLATYQSGFLNPFNILFFFFQTETAWSLYIIFQIFLLSFLTYLYCRKINISLKGAIFTSVIFTFSGFVIVRLIFSNLVYSLAMLPFILYLIEDYTGNEKSKKVFLLPLAVAFMLFSGHPHLTVYVVTVSISYLLYKILTSFDSTSKKISAFLFISLLFVIGIGIASVQILPTIELLKQSNMNSDSSAFIFDRFLLPFSHLVTILIPNYFGNQATYNYWGAGDYIETIAAVGLIPSFFAYFSFLGKNDFSKNHKLFFLIAFIISILLTLDWFFPKLLSTLPIPIISTSPPSRIFGVTSFFLAILAGYGFDQWIKNSTNFKRLLLQVVPFIVIILIIVIATFLFYRLGISCNNQFITNCRLIAVRNTVLETSAFLIALGAFFFYQKIRHQKIRLYVPFVIITLVFFLGVYNANKFFPFSKREAMSPQHALIESIKDKTKEERVFGLGEANIKTNFATHFRFYDPNYYDPLHNKRYAELISFANNGTASNLSRSDIEIASNLNLSKEKQLRRDRLLNLLGVEFIIFKKSEKPLTRNNNVAWQDENWYLLKNPNYLPRAYLVNKFEVFRNSEKLLNRLFNTSLDPAKTVLLEEQPSSFNNSVIKQFNNVEDGKVAILQYNPNKTMINVDTNSDKLLVLSDNFYPGWKAFIDNKEVPVYRANYTFRAIKLPKGKHTVVFSYQPKSFTIGLSASLITLFFYFIFIFYKIRIH